MSSGITTYAIKVCYGDDVFSFPFSLEESESPFDALTKLISNKIKCSKPSVFTYEDDIGDQIIAKNDEDLRWALQQALVLQNQNVFPRLKITIKNVPTRTPKKTQRRIVRHEDKYKEKDIEIKEDPSKNEEDGKSATSCKDQHEENDSDEGSDWNPEHEKMQAKRHSHPSNASTFYETAIAVLQKTRVPMTAAQVTKYAIENDLLKTTGKTPKNTMSAMFSESLRKRASCPFRAFREINAYGLKEIDYEIADETEQTYKRKAEDAVDEEGNEKIRRIEESGKKENTNEELIFNREVPKMEPDAIY